MLDFFISHHRAFLDILTIWILAVVMPGADMFLVITSSIQRSKAYALMAGLGIVIGTLVWLLVGFFLIGVLSQTAFFKWVQIFGGSYLIWMALRVLFSLLRNKEVEQRKMHLESTAWKGLLYGVLTNLSNPKPPIFVSIILSNLPQPTPIFEQSILLCIMTIIPAIWFSLVVFIFRIKRVLNLFLQYSKWLDILAVIVFGIFGTNLLIGAIASV